MEGHKNMARVINKFQYGVELECFVPTDEIIEEKEQIIERIRIDLIDEGYNEDKARDVAIRRYNEGYYQPLRQHTDFINKIKEAGAEVVTDGSITSPDDTYKAEIRAGVYSDANVEEKIAEICEIANSHNANVNKSCGYHLHTSHTKFLQRPTINRLVHVWSAIEDVLYLTQPQSRFNNHYCRRLLRPFIGGSYENLPKQKREIAQKLSNLDRYTSLNLKSLSKHKTVEVRLHSGTLDKDKIINWIKLMKAIYEYVFYFYDKDVVHKILNMPINTEKVQIVFELLQLSDELKAYFTNRINKFYDESNWQIYTERLAQQNIEANKALLERQEILAYKKKVEKIRLKYEEINRKYKERYEKFINTVEDLK